ncbi:MAG: hypothetical protein Q4G03_00340 [Planctomycetia bacterium]|nr:hypothetical protein [Planctomycetia bacterium]
MALINLTRQSISLTASAFFFAIFVLFAPSASAQEERDLGSVVKFSQGLSQLFKSPKTTDSAEPEEDASLVSSATASYQSVLPVPQSAGLVVEISSLTSLDAGIKEFFKGTSDTEFSILSSLRLTEFRRVLAKISQDAPLGVLVFTRNAPLELAVVLPVEQKDFQGFVESLTSACKCAKPQFNEQKDVANFQLKFKETVDVVAKVVNERYIAIVPAGSEALFTDLQPSFLRADTTPPQGLKAPVLIFEGTPTGLANLTAANRPIWGELAQAVEVLKRERNIALELDVNKIRDYIAQNLQRVRIEVGVDEYGLYTATETTPRPNSEGSRRISSYHVVTPLNTEADRFFSVLPDVEAALAGQTEFTSVLTQALPKPFNRLRFVEYSLTLPTDGELLGESWLFYLEVDDAEEFAKELIIPKAREIGRYIGSKTASDAASQLMGNLAERRQSRQFSRRNPPRRAADPERASAVGGALGSALGGLLGESAGEETAMKENRINGYKTYISDIETYVRQTALMRAEEQGYQSPSLFSELFKGDRPLASGIGLLMAAVENGNDMQAFFLQSSNAQALEVDQSPLIARKGYLVILDKNHILYGLGNQDLLRLGISNYRSLSNPRVRYLSQTPDPDAPYALKRLGMQIPDLAHTNMVAAVRIDPSSAQAYYRWIRDYYFPNLPLVVEETLSPQTPKALLVTSVTPQSEIARFVLPHATTSNLFETFANGMTPLQAVLSGQKSGASADGGSESSGEDLDDLFE